ncbi:hypothetical protein [Coraliomargarita parva]|uniref:hypothetical protein n=1 Tax=Coraliomargarita parva TaxID=3014050 RepID=UPI0022B3587D|nr:hypothetical protein [Coraliomargarita parva]
MPKIDVDTLKAILQRNETDIRKISEIMEDIKMELLAEEEERANRPPPVKKQFSILISDPEGHLEGKDFVGWVVQIPEEDSLAVGPERIIRAAYEYNTTPKGRRLPVQTIGEACEVVSAKLMKEQNIWIKTKTPVLIVPTNNQIPTDNSE